MKPCMYIPLQEGREGVLDCLGGAHIVFWGEAVSLEGFFACLRGPTVCVCGDGSSKIPSDAATPGNPEERWDCHTPGSLHIYPLSLPQTLTSLESLWKKSLI